MKQKHKNTMKSTALFIPLMYILKKDGGKSHWQFWLLYPSTLFLIFASLLSVTPALAETAEVYEGGKKIVINDMANNKDQKLISWLPGEKYDPGTATMDHYVTDLNVSGKGLDISIGRKLNMDKTRISESIFTEAGGGNVSINPQSFGTMMLDTPRLEYITYSHDEPKLKCSGLVIRDQKNKPSDSRVLHGGGLVFYADGLATTFFPKSLGSYANSRFPSEAEYVSSSNWYIDCDGSTFRVHRPNGVVYHLNVLQHQKYVGIYLRRHSSKPHHYAKYKAKRNVVFVKEIVDPHNNFLTYNYSDSVGVAYSNQFVQKLLVSITSNDDRVVTIKRRPIPAGLNSKQKARCLPLIEEISYNKDPSKNVLYEYDPRVGTGWPSTACRLRLNRTVYRDGTFHYDYNINMTNSSYPLSGGQKWSKQPDVVRQTLKSITYPKGAKVSYEYVPLEICAFTTQIRYASNWDWGCPTIPALSKRTVSGDLIPSGMTWTFKTIQSQPLIGGRKLFRSLIEGPIDNHRRTLQVFHAVAKDANVDPSTVGADVGQLIGHDIYDVHENYNYKYLKNPIKSTLYRWGFYGDVVDFSKLNSWNVKHILDWQNLYHSRGRQITEEIVSLDGQTFKTEGTLFNIYGMATTQLQNHNNLQRKVKFNYLNRKSPWVIGVVSKRTVERANGTNDFVELGRTFYNTGKVKVEGINGINKMYTYHTDGELHRIKNGDGVQIGMLDDYTLGIPTKQVRASSNGSALKHVTLYGTGKVKTESAWDKTKVKTTFNYYPFTGKHNITTPHLVKSFKEFHPKWNSGDSSDVNFRREYKEMGALVVATHFDTLGRPLIHFKQDNVTGEKVFTYYRYDIHGRLAYQSLPVETNYISQINSIYSTPMLAGYTYKYDALGRMTHKNFTKDSSRKTRYCYSQFLCEEAGMKNTKHNYGVVTKDAEGYITVVNYRAYGHPLDRHVMEVHQQISGPKYVSTILDRDPVNIINSVTQDGVTRRYTYKPGTRLLASETHPETGMMRYTSYDNRGNLEEKISADNSVTKYTYYQNDLLHTITYPSGTGNIVLAYNNDDSLKSVVSGGVIREFSYRDDGLLTTETLKVDNETMTLVYKHDDYGYVNKTTYPSGQSVQQINNTFGWLKTITNVATDILYHANGVMSQAVLQNGQRFTATLDKNDRVERWKTLDQEGDSDVQHLWYSYDTRGNISSLLYMLDQYVDNDPHTISMGYDGLNRLTTADSNGLWGDGHIEYNKRGDITKLKLGTEELNYNYEHSYPGNRTELLRSISSTSGLNTYLFDYDVNGNVTDNGNRSFNYDKANRMTHADVGGRVYDFRYDGDGRRVSSIRHDTNANNAPIGSTKVTQYFFYSSDGKLMYEKNKNTGIRKDRIFANGKVIAERHYYNPSVDTDNDGIPNHYEELYGLQPDNHQDATNDSDNDGLSNFQEYEAGSNPNSVDTDDDGVNDLIEADYGMNIVEDDSFEDTDGDGVTNYNEVIAGTNPADDLVEQRMKAIIPIIEIILVPNAN